MKQLVLLILVLCVVGCVTTIPVRLTGVVRPQAALEKFGEAKISEDGYVFEDGLIAASWSFFGDSFTVRVTNKTTNPISVQWDNASFVDALGNAHRLVRGDVTIMNTALSQAPIAIPAGATSLERLFSPDGIFRLSGGPIIVLPYYTRKSPTKNIAVMIPFEIDGEKETYTFAFRVLDSNSKQQKQEQQ